MSISVLTSGFIGVIVGAFTPVGLVYYQDHRAHARWKFDALERALDSLTGGTQKRSIGLASLELMIRHKLLPPHSEQVVGRVLWNQFEYLQEAYHLDAKAPTSQASGPMELSQDRTPNALKAHEADNIVHIVDLLTDTTLWTIALDKLDVGAKTRLEKARNTLRPTSTKDDSPQQAQESKEP
ncbi:MAG: hypothetical protein ACP5PJ_06730 [Acidimicrobiales bacterium]